MFIHNVISCAIDIVCLPDFFLLWRSSASTKKLSGTGGKMAGSTKMQQIL